MNGYDFTKADLPLLLVRKYFPERTDRESRIILDWLAAHGDDYDRITFSVHIGDGLAPNPDHLPGIQKTTTYSTQKRIDVLAWQGSQPTIIEVKERVTPAALGQILTYRVLFLEELPDAPEPRLVVIGRYSDPDTIKGLNAHGVDVLLYPADVTAGASAAAPAGPAAGTAP